MRCSDHVWLTMVKIPALWPQYSSFSIAMRKLTVTCKQLVMAGEVYLKVDWMRLANVLVVFGRPAVKRSTECARDNVLLLCAHVIQCLIPVYRQNNIYRK